MIRFLRSIIIVSEFIIFGLGACFIRYVIFPIRIFFMRDKTNKLGECSDILHKSWIFFIKLLIFFKTIKIESNDIEKLSNIKNSIIVSTHPSFIDVVILISIIPRTTCFVAEKLSKNPFFKGMVNLLFILEGKENWIKDAKNFSDKGFNILIFPSGTRHRANEHIRIHRGTAHLANVLGKKIEAVKLVTDFDFLQINQPFYDAGERTVTYSISYLGSIDTQDYLQKYSDEITFKTNLTKAISDILYND